MVNQFTKIDKSNSFEGRFPSQAKEWDYSKNDKKPSEVLAGSNKKAWWICIKQHSWEATISSRQRVNCPYCANKRIGYGNDFETNFSEIAKQWDYSKNDKNPSEYSPSSGQKVWWLCDHNHSYKATIDSRTRYGKERGCPYCVGQKVGFGNDFETNFPEIAKQWDYSKNDKNPSEYTHTSGAKVWFICKEQHSYKQAISYQKKGFGCPYCSGEKIGYGNDFSYYHPELLKEWDYEKNTIKPETLSRRSGVKVWWLCSKNHSFESSLHFRGKGDGCPYCSGHKVGYGNDLKTRYPRIAKEWDYEKNNLKPSEVTPFTHKDAWWICNFGHSYRSRIASRTGSLQTGCPFCTLTPRSKDELYLLFELKSFFNIEEGDNKIKLDRVNDVDIILRNQKIVIEYDGSYWHKDKALRDKTKTTKLEKAGWLVIRVREKPLKILSRKFNVSSKSGDYKETANKVLKKLDQLGYKVSELNEYLNRKELLNKKQAEMYMEKILKEKNK